MVFVRPDDPPEFTVGAVPFLIYTENETIAELTLPEAVGGTLPLIYELDPALPPGLNFDPESRVLSGTPTAASPPTSYTYTATDAEGQSDSLSFTIEVVADDRPMFPERTVIDDQSLVTDEAIADLTLPEAIGGTAPLTYSLEPALPNGLSFDPAARLLSGTPAAPSPATRYTYTATDAEGRSASLSFTIEVDAEPGVVLSANVLTTEEGRDSAYSVRLNTDPEGTVSVTPQSVNPHVAFHPTSLTFDSGNWNTPQEIVLTVGENNLDDSVTVRHNVGGYGSLTEGGEIVVQVRQSAMEKKKQTVNETVAAVAAATVSNVTANIGVRFSAPSAPTAAPTPFADWSPKASLADGFGAADRDPWRAEAESTAAPTARDLLRSGAFDIALGAADGNAANPSNGNRVTVWGRGDFQVFESGGEAHYDGNLAAGYLGADLALDGGWLVGLAVSRIAVDADYRFDGGGGSLDAVLTNVHPYMRAAVGDRGEAWAILGLGQGEVEDAGDTSDLSMRMVSAGGRYRLSSGPGIDWTVLGDGNVATVKTGDGVRAIDGISAAVWQARLGVEASHSKVWDNGASLTSFLEVAARQDGGDTASGTGIEASPGMAFSDPASRVSVEVRGRVLAVHSARGRREHGVSLTASLAPRADGLGLQAAISPAWGQPNGSSLNAPDGVLFPAGAAARRPDALSLTSRVAWGFAAGGGVLAPFVDVSLYGGENRRMRMGSRYTLGPSAYVELSGDRREDAFGNSGHGLLLIARARF